ncbi:hypothetical protein Y032_0701g1651 [Ancylostoma ceylanicum]|uniref:Gamma interferon inducible lysosomal thiol reductase n=4 Tax=Ancylostoma ceylanicum TaxID=53326 RepID=A0A016WGD7_9BILA|nr:hypothetical protein Y032_0701g1651 [Ancylostoma ceylanicum]
MLMHDLLLQLLLFGQLVHTELPRTPPHPLLLLERDLENLSCLFFRRNCTNHLADLSSADRLFWKIMAPGTPEPPKLNTVRLEIYLEAQCPDTSRFIHAQLMKAWSLLSPTGRIELTLVPFGKARCLAKGDDFECSCQHGSNECILNQLMNCVVDRLGFPDKIVPIINCIQGKGNLDDAMRSCITNNALLNEQQMRDCATGPRGRRLLALAGSRTASLQPRLDFVPWIVINGERNGDALYDLTENLCKSLEPAPEQCAEYVKNEKKR